MVLIKGDPIFLSGYLAGRLLGKMTKHKIAAATATATAVTIGIEPTIPVLVTMKAIQYTGPWIVKVAQAHKRTGYIHPADYDLFDF